MNSKFCFIWEEMGSLFFTSVKKASILLLIRRHSLHTFIYFYYFCERLSFGNTRTIYFYFHRHVLTWDMTSSIYHSQHLAFSFIYAQLSLQCSSTEIFDQCTTLSCSFHNMYWRLIQKVC